LNRYWGRLDRRSVPVADCHGITEDRAGNIQLLTNDQRNNLVTYTKTGEFVTKSETRFPAAHALLLTDSAEDGELRWITDPRIGVVSCLRADGHEMRRLTRQDIEKIGLYSDLSKYRPTNVAVMPDGDFFISDGYGSHFIHHFDPKWNYVGTFGGLGESDENLHQPHAVWFDNRRTRPELLVCDRLNEQLKWFTPDGELVRILPVPGARPCNVAPFVDGHLAIPCLNGMVLILDPSNQIISVIGGELPHSNGNGLKLEPYNYAFNHPHDAHVDASGDIYIAQWNSNCTYPIKLEIIDVGKEATD